MLYDKRGLAHQDVACLGQFDDFSLVERNPDLSCVGIRRNDKIVLRDSLVSVENSVDAGIQLGQLDFSLIPQWIS